MVAAAGDIANSSMRAERTAKLLDALDPDAVLTLGDNAYPDGTLAQFLSCYDPTSGRHKGKTRPVPGNHEYQDPVRAAPDYFAYFGTAAGEPGKGYYSFDLGSWHIVALNSSYHCSLPCVPDPSRSSGCAGIWPPIRAGALSHTGISPASPREPTAPRRAGARSGRRCTTMAPTSS